MHKLSKECHVRQKKTLRTDGLLKNLNLLDSRVFMWGSVNMGLVARYPIVTVGLCNFSLKMKTVLSSENNHKLGNKFREIRYKKLVIHMAKKDKPHLFRDYGMLIK